MSDRRYSVSRRARAAILIALMVGAAIVVIDFRPNRSRRFSAMNHSHERGVVRTIAPHMGLVGEILLRRDCGQCHDASKPATVALPKPPAELPRAPASPHAGTPFEGKSCVQCHAPTPAKA